MSKRLYALIVGLTSAVCAAGIVLVTYFNPHYAEAINGSISLFEGFVAGVCALFLDESNKEKKNGK